VSVAITNPGAVAGAEVVQLYVGYPAAAGEPPQLLRAFAKTRVLAPGEAQTVAWALGSRAFAIFDVVTDDWAVLPGAYTVHAAASSRDVRLSAQLHL
jgi:beta-glucosidase